MRKVYCDCCKREIASMESLYSMEIKEGQDEKIVVQDMCADCYGRIECIVDRAESWRKMG